MSFELVTAFSEELTEMDLALHRIARAALSAYKPLSVSLRKLLATGQGNDLLKRVSEKLDVEVAPVWQTSPPGPSPAASQALGDDFFADNKRYATYGIWNMIYDSQLDAPGDAVEVPFYEAIDKECCRFDQQTLTWRSLAKTVGDKLGAHADDEIPAELDFLEGLIVGQDGPQGLSYMLERLGRVVLSRGQELLGMEDRPVEPDQKTTWLGQLLKRFRGTAKPGQ